MPRKKIIAGNWKMNKTAPEAVQLVSELKEALSGLSSAEVVICPPFTAIYPVSEKLAGTNIALGAQNVFWKASGAYTGQISAKMLTDLNVTYVIVGHSEPRGRFGVPEENAEDEFYLYFGESDHTVNLKVHAALKGGLYPIICVGETLEERNQGQTDQIIQHQIVRALIGIESSTINNIVFAYEPVWAIGTGEVCGADEADRVCGVIRKQVGTLLGAPASENIRIQYGGSMKPDNAVELLSKENIDGGLVGGASLKASDFSAIVRAAESLSVD
jgi:triosephosphate isomerase (TIM)